MIDKPVGYRVIIRPYQLPKNTAGGLARYGSDDEWEREQRSVDYGEVLAVGPDAFKGDGMEGFAVSVGDWVRFKMYAGQMFRYKDEYGRGNGEWYAVINDQDIYTIMENPNVSA